MKLYLDHRVFDFVLFPKSQSNILPSIVQQEKNLFQFHYCRCKHRQGCSLYMADSDNQHLFLKSKMSMACKSSDEYLHRLYNKVSLEMKCLGLRLNYLWDH